MAATETRRRVSHLAQLVSRVWAALAVQSRVPSTQFELDGSTAAQTRPLQPPISRLGCLARPVRAEAEPPSGSARPLTKMPGPGWHGPKERVPAAVERCPRPSTLCRASSVLAAVRRAGRRASLLQSQGRRLLRHAFCTAAFCDAHADLMRSPASPTSAHTDLMRSPASPTSDVRLAAWCKRRRALSPSERAELCADAALRAVASPPSAHRVAI